MQTKRLSAGPAGIPAIGLGTWPLSNDEAARVVPLALEAGYRHVDTARMYGNEAGVGQGLAASPVPRADVFLTTKIWPDDHAPDRLRRVVLKLAFTDHIKYCRNEGARTTKIAFPFKALDGLENAKLGNGAGEGTRTPTPKAPEPKSGASTNSATPACALH